jgi:hypothetical protein
MMLMVLYFFETEAIITMMCLLHVTNYIFHRFRIRKRMMISLIFVKVWLEVMPEEILTRERLIPLLLLFYILSAGYLLVAIQIPLPMWAI